jgi:hypothetical protein
MAELFWSNGVVMLLLLMEAEEANAASLLKLLLFVVIGLVLLLENILPSFKAEFEFTDSPSGGGLERWKYVLKQQHQPYDHKQK